MFGASRRVNATPVLAGADKENDVPVASRQASGSLGAAGVKAKEEARARKVEARLVEAERELIELKRSKEEVDVELRLAGQKRLKLESALEKARSSSTSGTNLAALRAQFKELESLHATSKSEWSGAVAKNKTERDEARSAARRLGQEVESLRVKVEDAQTENAEWRAELDRRSAALSEAEQRAEDAEAKLQEQLEQHGDASQQMHSLQEQITSLEEEVQSLDEQVDLFRGREQALMKASASIGQELQAAKLDRADVMRMMKISTAQGKAAQAQMEQMEQEKGMSEDALSAVKEQEQSLRSQLAEAQEHIQKLQSRPFCEIHISAESSTPPQCQHAPSDNVQELQLDREAYEAAIADVKQREQLIRIELDGMQDMVTRMQHELADFHERQPDLLREASLAHQAIVQSQELKKRVSTQEAQLSALNASLAKAREEAVEGSSRAQAWQVHNEALQKEACSLKEQNKCLVSRLNNAKAKEDRWSDDCNELQEALANAERYQSAYETLSKEHKVLLSRASHAESEASLLSTLNADLASHENPMQKVHYMDRLRRERDEAKYEVVGLEEEVRTLRQQMQEIKRKLHCFEAIEVPLAQRQRTTLTRVKRYAHHRSSSAIKSLEKIRLNKTAPLPLEALEAAQRQMSSHREAEEPQEEEEHQDEEEEDEQQEPATLNQTHRSERERRDSKRRRSVKGPTTSTPFVQSKPAVRVQRAAGRTSLVAARCEPMQARRSLLASLPAIPLADERSVDVPSVAQEGQQPARRGREEANVWCDEPVPAPTAAALPRSHSLGQLGPASPAAKSALLRLRKEAKEKEEEGDLTLEELGGGRGRASRIRIHRR